MKLGSVALFSCAMIASASLPFGGAYAQAASAQYRAKALECEQIARNTHDLAIKEQFEALAREWRAMADNVDRQK